jgi:hypothetical protein
VTREARHPERAEGSLRIREYDISPLRPLRNALVLVVLAGWLSPLASTVARPDPCCCPEGMHGACALASAGSCSLKRCPPEDGGVLIAAKVVLSRATALPAPTEYGRVDRSLSPAAAEPSPDPSEPPPRA